MYIIWWEVGYIMKCVTSSQNFYKLKQGFIQINETIQMRRKCSKKNHKVNVLITVGLVWDVK